MEKILIINVNWLGDVIFSTPALKAIRNHFPKAYISCLVISRCEEVLKNNPRINEIIVYDEDGKHKSLWTKIKFIRYLRKKHFDTVFVLHPSLKRAMIGFLAGIPNRIGYSTKKRKFLLTQAIPANPESMHKIDYFLYLLSQAGIPIVDRKCEFFLSEQDEKDADLILKQVGLTAKDSFVVLNPGGNWLMKRWPVKYFSLLADWLIQKKKIKVVIAGAKGDRVLAQQIVNKVKSKLFVITGLTTLHQLAAIMVKSRCVVTADSGPMHIAVAAGANTLAIFGPTAPELTGPIGQSNAIILRHSLGCKVPCYKSDCESNFCMEKVTPQMVYDELIKFL
ncbi:MAG: lipopolysaccharide heptosyltransferase II [Candidatus Omnitrophica bacterium]|nr:lipopolysaccharide heptosyltransferase II [Candidatus Omnitrophota bacterium]